MRSWLHWIGNEHYTIPEFIKEAKLHGVSRRVPRNILRTMEPNDRIYLASKQKGLKSPVMFGYFTAEEFAAIQKLDELDEEVRKKVLIKGRQLVKRGCGYQIIGAVYLLTEIGLEEVTFNGEDKEVTGGLKVFPKPWPQFFKMPPFRGFRPFDSGRCLSDICKLKAQGERLMLKEFYYA